MAALSKQQYRERLVEAAVHERGLEVHGHTHGSRLTLVQRARCRVGVPDLIGLYATVYDASRRRGRFGPGEQKWLEHRLGNWDRCSQAEITRVRARIMELVGLFEADEQLASCGLDE